MYANCFCFHSSLSDILRLQSVLQIRPPSVSVLGSIHYYVQVAFTLEGAQACLFYVCPDQLEKVCAMSSTSPLVFCWLPYCLLDCQHVYAEILAKTLDDEGK